MVSAQHQRAVWPEPTVAPAKPDTEARGTEQPFSHVPKPAPPPQRSRCPHPEAELTVVLHGSTRPGSGRPEAQTVPSSSHARPTYSRGRPGNLAGSVAPLGAVMWSHRTSGYRLKGQQIRKACGGRSRPQEENHQ